MEEWGSGHMTLISTSLGEQASAFPEPFNAGSQCPPGSQAILFSVSPEEVLAFCDSMGLPPLPLLDRVLCLFVAFLKNQGLAHQSIMSYFSGVRNLAIANGDTLEKRGNLPRLQLVLRGWLEPHLTTTAGQSTSLLLGQSCTSSWVCGRGTTLNPA
uniref:Uncharacterized protein n=1 Tax=Amphimedon queenslandica TaxID=400682 RepID=A0A1X7UNJ6_AMPQE